MIEKSALTELARFVGQSALAAEDAEIRRRAINDLTSSLQPRPARRSVGELLGAVLALSARTRRAALAPVIVDLDVFGPGGKRAVRMVFGRRR